ncbi:MAG: hypothetical protein GC154_09675 [bacterium]|nr:hypothetical protein [bacterium]
MVCNVRRVRIPSLKSTRILLTGALVLACSLAASANGQLASWIAVSAAQTGAQAQTSVKHQVDYLLNLARQEIRGGNVDEGKALLQRVLILDPLNEKAKQELIQLTDSGVSIAPSSKAIASAMSTDQTLQLAQAMMKDNDFSGAQATLEKAMAAAKTKEEKTLIRGYLAQIDKEQSRMQTLKAEVTEYNLSNLDKQLQKASLYMSNNQYEEAKKELLIAQEMAPGDKRVEGMLAQAQRGEANMETKQGAVAENVQSQVNEQSRKVAQQLFSEGQDLYKQGMVIEATEKWSEAARIAPDFQQAQTYLNNTHAEYEQAVAARSAKKDAAAKDAEFEKKLDEEILQYSTSGGRVDIKEVISFLSNLSGLNAVVGENVEGGVAFDVKDSTVRQLLNLLQKQYGFVWRREGDTIFVERAFQTRIFPLSEAQYKTIETILNDPSVLEDSSRNLRTILYGPSEEFNVPGKQLYLNRNTQSLVVTDTLENLKTVEAFLKDMPQIVGEKKPLVTQVYQLDRDISKDLYEIIRLMLFGDKGTYDAADKRRQLFLEPNSNTLIVIDYPENIKRVEDVLANQQISSQLENDQLEAREFSLTDVDDVEDTPEAFARRELFVNKIYEIVEQMLMGKEGVEKYKLSGRRIFTDPARGTLTVVDSPENIRRVEEYLNSVRGETTQDILIESFPIKHVNVYEIADALAYLFFDSQQTTRNIFLSQSAFQSLGTDETGDTSTNLDNLFEETSRNRFNLTGGGGGGTDLLQFFSVRLYPDINTNSIVVFTPDQEVIDLIVRVINTFDKPQRMVELESRVVSVSLNDLRSINFDWLLTNPFRGDFNFDPNGFENNVGLTEGNPTDTDTKPGVQFSLHTLGESRLDFIMNLLETTSSLNVMAAPKILSVPNPLDPPRIFVGQQIPFSQDATIDDQGDDDPTNNRLIVNFERAFAGTMLAFIPFILNDNHVYVEMAPQIIEAGERLPLAVDTGLAAGQTLPNIGPLLLNQKAVVTSVRVKDGSTVVLGGLIDEKENEKLNKTPILSKIPFIGNLFTDRSIEKVKNSTLIFVTVRIVEPEL